MLAIQEISLKDLHPWENNPRLNGQVINAVAKSIESFGFNVPIICDQDLTIIGGHTRWKAAQKLGMDTIPVIRIVMTDTQRRAFAIADNKTAQIADWDFPKLKEVLEELKSEEIDIKHLGFSDEEIRRYILNEDDDENIVPEVKESTVTTKPGDLFSLENHRLLCGDSKNGRFILTLTQGHHINHVFGGPPYFNQRTYSQWKEYQAYLKDMKRIIQNCYSIFEEGAICVWNIANGCSTQHDHVSHHSRLFEKMDFYT